MSSAPKDAKPAAAKPAAAKAPAKAAAKGKGAAKPAVVKQTELRKKNKTPLVPKIVDPAVKAAQDKAKQVKKAATELRNKQKAAAQQARAAFTKAVAEAKKKGVAPPTAPVKATKTANKDKKKTTKKASKYAPNQRFYLKLSPLNEKFHSQFGFIFSELIGKSREKALCARNIHVKVTHAKHPLFGRVGKLRYYTGKHKAFVKIGHVLYKLPWSILGRSKLVDAQHARRVHRLRHAHRIANYTAHLKASKKNPKVKVPAKPVKTEFKEPAKIAYGKAKSYTKYAEKRKKLGKPLPAIVAKKAPAANAAAAVPFPNVGRPLKNRKAALRAAAAAEGKKKFAELKKAGKTKNYRKLRKQKAKTGASKPAAAAGAKTAAKPAAKPATKA